MDVALTKKKTQTISTYTGDNEKRKECLFHKNLKFGVSFHFTLAQSCHQPTLQMLELCTDLKCLFPTNSGSHCCVSQSLQRANHCSLHKKRPCERNNQAFHKYQEVVAQLDFLYRVNTDSSSSGNSLQPNLWTSQECHLQLEMQTELLTNRIS